MIWPVDVMELGYFTRLLKKERTKNKEKRAEDGADDTPDNPDLNRLKEERYSRCQTQLLGYECNSPFELVPIAKK